MNKALRLCLVLIFVAGIYAVFPGQIGKSQSAMFSQYQVTINTTAHQQFGLYYPVTYVFNFIPGVTNLTAQYRLHSTDAWNTLPTRTSSDNFNGVNAARFDYVSGTAYLSVAFALNSDNLFLHIVDSRNNEIPISFQSIPIYYDNRKAAVTISLDDWDVSANSGYNNAATILIGRNMHFTVAVITTPGPPWSQVQQWVNTGFMEVASHSRTQPCSQSDYESTGYAYQITGSKQDILANLTLPYPYVPTYIEPCGYEDALVRQGIIAAGYLDTRGFVLPPQQNTFSTWGTDGSYLRALYSIDTWSWPWYTQDNTLLAQANSTFDTAYAAGGIYHLVDHPWQGRWFTGSTLDSHTQYIANRSDVWYAAFGELYLYHYVQERGQVTINPVGLSVTATPTPTGNTPTPTNTSLPSTPTNTPLPPTPTNTPLPATPTNTSLPPTSTNTPLPPTPTLITGSTYSLWNGATVPDLGTVADPNPVELGVKFRSDSNGTINGIRFYKGPNNTGTHLGHLWTSSGTMLAEATFTGETTTGWQTATFASPVAITANTIYVASYHTDAGNYSMNQPYFTLGYYNAPLYAFGNSEVPGGNGVYVYGASAFPTQTFQASNYWVDVIFTAAVATNTPLPPTSTSLPPTFTDTPLPPTSTPTSISLPPTPTNTPLPPPPTSTNTPLPPTPSNTPLPPTPTNTPTATATPLPDLIFASDFETGNLAEWSSSVTDAGNLSVTTVARLLGSFGAQALINDNNPKYVQDSSPASEAHYRARFYFDPNSILMATGNTHVIFAARTGTVDVLRWQFRFSNNQYQVQGQVRLNSGSYSNTSWFTISDASHYLEFDWLAASTSTGINGSTQWWIDGISRATLSGLSNGNLRVDDARLGPQAGIDTGTRGTEFFDAFVSHRLTYIGP